MKRSRPPSAHLACCAKLARNDMNRAFLYREGGNVEIGYLEQDGFEGVIPAFAGLRIIKDSGAGRLWRNFGVGWSALERSGDAIFALVPDSQVDIRTEHRSSTFSLYFPSDQIEGKFFIDPATLFSALAQLQEKPVIDATAMQLIDGLWEAADENCGHIGHLFCESAAIALLARCATLSGVNAVQRPTRAGGLAPRTLRSVLALIEDRLGSELDLKALANQAGLSEFYFIRAFKKEMGVTPYQYVLRKRIEAVRRALEGGEQSLEAIARATGFGSEVTLSRQFLRHVGVTPHRYQKLRAA